MRIYVLLIILGLVLSSCNKKEIKKDEVIVLDSLKSEELKIAIINDTSEAKWVMDSFTSFWIPTQAQLNLIDTILNKAIKDDIRENYTRLEPGSYKNFYRQYVCYIENYSDSIVYISALCHISEVPVTDDNDNFTLQRMDWQHHLIFVEDGGACYWRIWINFTKRKYDNFIINGVA